MLLVSTAKLKELAKNIDNKIFDGITYKVEKMEGLMAHVSHNAVDEDHAAKTIKAACKAMPELKGMFLNIRIMDDMGKIR